jgi:hypothetical protein
VLEFLGNVSPKCGGGCLTEVFCVEAIAEAGEEIEPFASASSFGG